MLNIFKHKIYLDDLIHFKHTWKMNKSFQERTTDAILRGNEYILIDKKEYEFFELLKLYDANTSCNTTPVFKDTSIQGKEVVQSSNIPKYIDAGNLIYEKKYDEAIKQLLEDLNMSNNIHYNSMVHINLMVAYFHIKDIDNCNYHAKQALICGHNTGMAAERLIINLSKEKRYEAALQVCNMMTSPSFYYKPKSKYNSQTFEERKEKIIKHLTQDTEELKDSYFSKEEIDLVYKRSRQSFFIDKIEFLRFDQFQEMNPQEKKEVIKAIKTINN